MAVLIDSDVPFLYRMRTITVVGLIGIEIPYGGNRLISKEMFEEEKLSEVSDITGVAVLQRGALELLWSRFHTAIIDPKYRSCNDARAKTVLMPVVYLFFFILDDLHCHVVGITL
jgi:hypothetical protein